MIKYNKNKKYFTLDEDFVFESNLLDKACFKVGGRGEWYYTNFVYYNQQELVIKKGYSWSKTIFKSAIEPSLIIDVLIQVKANRPSIFPHCFNYYVSLYDKLLKLYKVPFLIRKFLCLKLKMKVFFIKDKIMKSLIIY